MFKGSIVALITPFKNNKLDEANYSKILHHHLSVNSKKNNNPITMISERSSTSTIGIMMI